MMMKTYRDHSMMFKGHVCHYTHKLPAMEVSGKAGQTKLQRCVESIIVCDVTCSNEVRWFGSSCVFCSPDKGHNVR